MNSIPRGILALALFLCLQSTPLGAATSNISPGQVLAGRVGGAGETNLYTFTAASGDVISVALVRTNGMGTPRLQLYDPVGSLLLDVGAAPAAYGAGVALGRNGTYTFAVTEASLAGTFDYLLSLTKVVGGVNVREPGDGVEQMAPGQIVGGHIGVADMDTYTFAGVSDEVISVTLGRTNGMGAPYLYLYDPLGHVVFESSGAPVVHAPAVVLPRNGTYTFVVVEGSLTGSYDYLLSLAKVLSGVNLREPGDAPEALGPGQTVGGHLGTADIDTYTFTASSDDVITVALARTNGLGAPFVYLFDPLGGLIYAHGATPVAYLSGVRLSRNGTYVLVVVEATLLDSYDYALSLTKIGPDVNQREPGDAPEPILPGQIIGGHIGAVDLDTYAFTAESNDVMSFTLARTNGLGGSYLYLYDPFGSLVFESGAPQTVHVDGVRLGFNGRYTLVVVEGTLLDSYDYLLNVTSIAAGSNQREPGDGPESILPGQFTGGHIDLADTDTIAFSAGADDVVSIALLVTNGPGTYPLWQLYGPDGVLMLSHAPLPTLSYVDQIRLPLAGTYTILVLDNSLEEEFDYRLSVHRVNGGNQRETGDGSELIVPGQFTGGHIELADTDGFAFAASANDVVSVALLVTNGPGTYPLWQVYGPDGSLVGAYVSSPTVSYYHEVVLPVTGTYTVLVLDNSLDEEFDYRLSVHRVNGGNQRETGDGSELIVPGQFTGGHIELADTDGFAFSALANDVVSVAVLVTNGPGTYPWWQLYAPDGLLIASQATSPTLSYSDQIRLPLGGTYRLLVLANSLEEEFDYRLSVHRANGGNQREPGDGSELIVPGQFTGGQIELADTDEFAFSANANDVVSVALLVTNGPGTYPAWYVYGPDGSLVAAHASGPTVSYYHEVVLPVTGTYTVLVLDNGLDEEFDYRLSVHRVNGGNQRETGDGSELIVPGQFTGGHIGLADTDGFVFSANASDVVSFVLLVTAGPGTYPWCQLYGPDGVLVIWQLYGPTLSYSDQIRLPLAGTYRFLVLDNNLDEEFDYSLCLVKNPGPNAPDPGDANWLVSPGDSVEGQVTAGDLDTFGFHVIAGDSLRLQVRSSSAAVAYPVMHLLAPDGTLVGSGAGVNAASIAVDCVTQTGFYQVFICDNELVKEFPYTFSYRQWPIEPPSSGTNQHLTVYLCDGRLYVRWPTNAVGFQLESAATLPPCPTPGGTAGCATNWTPVLTPLYISGDHFYVDEGSPNGTKFYRLVCPNCAN